jgi:integrase
MGERPRTLQLDETTSLEKVQDFLNSKGINSKSTKQVYHLALSHFQTFLSKSEYKDYNIETILNPISQNSIDIYSLLSKFVGYLEARHHPVNEGKLSSASFLLYMTAVRSYFEYHDIEISQKKFKRRVTLPKKSYGNREGIDAEDIRKILLACTNTRLKVFLLILASSGLRANEALSLRIRDLDFSISPTRVHIRAETTKTNQANDIYISDEASKELKMFMDSNDRKSSYDLILSIEKETEPISMYKTLHLHFIRLLEKVGMNTRRDDDQRRQISFHSFRAFVKTTISNQGYGDFSEWMLGHRGSMASRYYRVKELERREIYKKCMKYLTFLDYATVESVGRDFESKLEEQEKRHQEEMKQVNEKYDQIIDAMSKNPILSKVKADVLKKKIKKK